MLNVINRALIIILVLWAGQGWAIKNLYVDVDSIYGACSDATTYAANDQTHPFCTIQRGANVAVDGDTVIVADGVYTDTNSDTYVVRINASMGGSAGNPVTFRAENKWGALLDCGNNPAAALSSYTVGGSDGAAFRIEGNGGSYVTVDGFEMAYCTNRGISTQIVSSVMPHNLTFKNNHIHHIRDSAVGVSNGDTYDNTFDANLIHDISYSTYAGGSGSGISVCGDNITITNNIIYKIYDSNGLYLQVKYPPEDANIDQTNWTISNNTFGTTSTADSIGGILIWKKHTDMTIDNNIFYGLPGTQTGINCYSTPTLNNVLLRNNIMPTGHSILNSNCSGLDITATGTITGNPLFTDAPNDNYIPLPSSPALEAGHNLSGIVDADYAGTARPQNTLFDIGAYEILTYQCNNGDDDDNDGLIDYPDDTGCSNATDDSELNSITPPNLVVLDTQHAVIKNKLIRLKYNLAQEPGYLTPTVTFKYDQIGTGCDGTAIASCTDLPSGNNASCDVDTSSFAPGKYYFCGTTSGGSNIETVYMPHWVNVFQCTAGENTLCVPELKVIQ